jgi:alpha-beta hydrolase superfamily lysophospholipase
MPAVLIGHSLGGLTAARFVQRDQPDVVALVLSGPVVGGNPQVEVLLGMDPMPEVPIDPSILSRDSAIGEAYAADELVYHGGFHRETWRRSSPVCGLSQLDRASVSCLRYGSMAKETSWHRSARRGRR